MNIRTQLVCPNCHKEKSKERFFKSILYNKKDVPYLPYCMECIFLKTRIYTDKVHSKEGGLWLICAELGVPVIQKILNMTLEEIASANKPGKKNIFTVYYSLLQQEGYMDIGFWQSDIMLDKLLGKLSINEPKVEEEKIHLSEYEKLKLKWGEYENTQDYEFLEWMFNQYTCDLEEMDVVLERRYIDLCKAELTKRRADEKGDVSEIAKAQDNLSKLLALLKLNDFQSKQKTDEMKHIEYLMYLIENVEPAECEDLEIYKDYSGREHAHDENMRCLQNLIAGTREYPQIGKELLKSD